MDYNNWSKVIKKIIGFSFIEDFYEIKEIIGKGKFSVVKCAIHKKTSKKVAVKIIKKKAMTK